MAIENDPSARMQVRSRGELLHPGSCCVCGNGTCDDGYLDLGVFYDYEGTMYICMACAYQAVETVGCFTPEQVKITNDAGSKALEENTELRKELDNARHHIDSVNAVLRSKFLPSSDPADSVPQEPERDTKPASKPSTGGTTRKPVVKESTPFS